MELSGLASAIFRSWRSVKVRVGTGWCAGRASFPRDRVQTRVVFKIAVEINAAALGFPRCGAAVATKGLWRADANEGAEEYSLVTISSPCPQLLASAV